LDQAQRQAALVGKRVRLKNLCTRDEIAQFRVSSVTWISIGVEGRRALVPGPQKNSRV
jgi:hypothetical protein